VERVDDGLGDAPGDARERPWRSVATGWEFRPTDEARHDAVTVDANRRLAHAGIDEEARLAHESADRYDDLDEAWHAATIGSTYNLRLTASELAELAGRLDALIRPYIALTRDDAPPEAEAVHVALRAFKRPLP
jgi:hypothetical protein